MQFQGGKKRKTVGFLTNEIETEAVINKVGNINPTELADAIIEMRSDLLNDSESESSVSDDDSKMDSIEESIETEKNEEFLRILNDWGITSAICADIETEFKKGIPTLPAFRKKLNRRMNKKISKSKCLRIRAFMNDPIINSILKTSVKKIVNSMVPYPDANSVPKNIIFMKDMPPIPKTQKEAYNHKYADMFKQAEQEEINSHHTNGTWGLTSSSEGRKILKSKWVYDYKVDVSKGILIRFKARLVAAGYDQIAGVDFTETYAPVIRTQSLRLMLVIGYMLGLHIDQMDVSTAFLNADLSEPNYMKMAPGYQVLDGDGIPMVCQLRKSIYGLHQSAREWFNTLSGYLISKGYTAMIKDPCIFFKFDEETGKTTYVLVYVDDLLLMASDKKLILQMKEMMNTKFKMKDLGEAKHIIGLQYEKIEKDGIYVGQPEYTKTLLENYNMWNIDTRDGSIPIDTKQTPMVVNWEHDEFGSIENPIVKEKYRSLIMSLQYLAQNSRPDISFTVSYLAQYMEKPNDKDWDALMRILRYLRGTWDLGLYYHSSALPPMLHPSSDMMDEYLQTLEGFGDASHANEQGRKSRSGYCFILAGAAVSWYCKKQNVVALSSTEAEFIALSEAIKDALWYRHFFEELGWPLGTPVVVNQDNKSTIAVAMNPINHKMTKHIGTRVEFFRDHIKKNEIELIWCGTEDMIADIFTKALPGTQHMRLTSMLGLRSLSDLLGASVIQLESSEF